MARLVKRYPLFLSVGGYTGNAVLLCSGLQDPTLPCLFPDAVFPQPAKHPGKRRSPVPFLWAPVLLLAVCAALLLAGAHRPGILPYAGRLLWLPMAAGVVWLWIALEGWRGDCLVQTACGLPAVCTTHRLTHHHICILRRPAAVRWQNPFSRRVGRCELRLGLPGRRAISLHSLRLADCDCLFDSSQEEVN